MSRNPGAGSLASVVDHVVVQVIMASRPEWIVPFTGLEPGQFRTLVRLVAKRGGDEIADGRPGRQWALPLADRVLLVAVYWRTNLTMRQIGPLFGVSHSAAHRVIDTLGPLLALAPVRKRRVDAVAIVDGTLVPTRDHRVAAPSKNYRYSTNVQVAIDAETRLVIATGDPLPGNRNDCTAYRDSGIADQLDGRPVMADGGYQGNREVIMPYRKPADGSELPEWKHERNATHRKVRARVEHTLARMKCWKILRDYRRAATTLTDAVSGIAHLHNITLAS
jgi:DDE superfamily endonuclease/Helix-turn-helix of DDE superfamily endonuclease